MQDYNLNPNKICHTLFIFLFVRDFPYQADQLIQRFKDDRIDYNNDWKLITLFVGGNDLCQYCFNQVMIDLYK